MPSITRCVVCKLPIYRGVYCSECQNEIGRSRTFDEPTVEEWIGNRSSEYPPKSNNNSKIDEFFEIA
ncbi:MAG: nucleotide-binding protein [Thermoplasmataceae archaeon]